MLGPLFRTFNMKTLICFIRLFTSLIFACLAGRVFAGPWIAPHSNLGGFESLPLPIACRQEPVRTSVPHPFPEDNLVDKPRRSDRPRPSSATILGVDVSQYQGNINFSQLNGAVSFAVIRADYGAPDPGQSYTQYADTKFAQNRANAEQQGMEIGFYHYAYPQYNSADAEAQCFIDNVGSLKAGEFVCLDFEEWSYTGDVVSWCKTWLDDVQAGLGVRPLLYISSSRAASSSYNWSSVINANYGLWAAEWSGSPTTTPPTTQWPFMAMRQYDDNGSEPGISGAVDQDVFYGSLAQLQQYGFQEPAINWVGTLPPQYWYNANEEYPYQASGSGPLTCKEIIDGNVVATYTTSSGYLNLQAAPNDGWHELWVEVSDNFGNKADTSHYFGGWDLTPPSVTLQTGTPQHWYNASNVPASFQWLCDEPEDDAGIWHYQYKWDSNSYSDWIDNPNGPDQNHHRPGCTGTASPSSGKHSLYVHAQDDVWNGTNHTGNDTVVDLGEFWIDTTPPVVTSFTTSVPSPSNAASIVITCTATDDLSGVDHINITVDGAIIGTITGGSGSVTWNTTSYSKGSHTLSSVAYDVAGNSAPGVSLPFILGTSQLSSVSLSPSTVTGGSSSTGTVTLTGPAPTGGIVIALSSSYSRATVPATVTVASGATTATFTVNTTGVQSTSTATITASSNGTSQTAVLTLNAPTLQSVSISPTSLIGGNKATGTVTLSGPAAIGGVGISLSSSSTSAPVQANVTVAAGATMATFPINTMTVSSSVTATITASHSNISQTATLTVNPVGLNGLSLAPTTLIGGVNSTGTVTLNTAAPTGGTIVNLTSSSTNAKVPATVTVAAGATSATFTVTTLTVSATTSATITGTLNSVSLTAALTINPATVTGVSLNPSSVTGGSSSTGTVTLNGPAPAAGIVVTLSSSNTTYATVPASVSVAAGSSTGTFTVSTAADQSTKTAVITTGLSGSSQAATLTIIPPALASLSLSPTTLVGGAKATGTVTLTGPAAAGGVGVSLSSSNTSATIQANVTVLAGATSATFPINTTVVTTVTTSTITAAHGTVTDTATLTINPYQVNSVTATPTSVIGGDTSEGTVTISSPAPTGGLPVNLSSNSTSAGVPATVTVPAGATSVGFSITTTPVATATSPTIQASIGTSQATASITVIPPTIVAIVFSPQSVAAGQSTTLYVLLSGPAPAGATLNVTSSSTRLTIGSTLTCVAGQTVQTFTLPTTAGPPASVSVTVSYNSSSESDVLTITS